MASRRNIWPFGDSTKTTTVYHRRGASFARGANYKGYRVWEDENGWHTSLDPGSWFDSQRDAKNLIDSWEKDRKNPRNRKNILPLSSLASGAGSASGILGPSEKWLKKHRLMPKGKGNPMHRRNPEAESADGFEAFHGFRPTEQITVEKDVHYHSELWAIGELIKLIVVSPDGIEVDITGFKGAMLSANEANTQLYIEGGDQTVNLSDFGLGEPYHDKEDLGEVKKLFYFTDKTHMGDQGGEAVYHHKLGEEGTKRNYEFGKLEGRKVPRPRLAYDVVNQALEFIGGEYVIEPEGIRN